jgi:chaperone modulatory protein CbpM
MSDEILSGMVVDEAGALTLEQLASACGADVAWVRELVAEGVLEPAGGCFTSVHLSCARRVRRIQRDFEVDMGAAIVIADLLGQIERLEARLRQMGGELP